MKLDWGTSQVNLATSYVVQNAQNDGGPYSPVATLPGSTATYRHTGLDNGTRQYYVVTASLPSQDVAISSRQVSATPMGNLAPLPPAGLACQVGAATNGQSQILFSWGTSAGAGGYQLAWCYAGSSLTNLYSGSGVTYCWPLPASVQSGQRLTFQVSAWSASGLLSDPAVTTFVYEPPGLSPTNGPTPVRLSLGNHCVAANGDTLTITGPTNLVLRASVTAGNAANSQVFFYDCANGACNLINAAPGPQAQVTWFAVPQGTHVVMAQAVAGGGDGLAVYMGVDAGQTYNSPQCLLTVQTVPDLASYQTAATDLQLPAPGLPLTLARAYDSRNTNAPGALGQGWTASWDGTLTLAAPLSGGWVEAGLGGFAYAQYLIAETNSHLVTVALPDGSVVGFNAVLSVPGFDSPVELNAYVELDFNPGTLTQGALTCAGAGNPGPLGVVQANQNDDTWANDALTLVTADDAQPFIAGSFIYTTPDLTRYVFGQPAAPTGAVWKLSQVINANGNGLTLSYNASNQVTAITHGNGRQVQFAYASGTTLNATNAQVNGTWLRVYDTAWPNTNGTCPPSNTSSRPTPRRVPGRGRQARQPRQRPPLRHQQVSTARAPPPTSTA